MRIAKFPFPKHSARLTAEVREEVVSPLAKLLGDSDSVTKREVAS